MKKKIVSIALACALFAVAVAGGTLAYFTADDAKENNFTVGNAAIELQEPSWNADNAKDMYPGQTIAKDPQVQNTGKNPVFIRVKVVDPKDVNVTYNEMSDKWAQEGEYYYYKESVAPGATTEPLFKSFTLSTATENGIDNAQQIKVKAEAVQSQGFTGDVTAVADLASWFTTCGL